MGVALVFVLAGLFVLATSGMVWAGLHLLRPASFKMSASLLRLFTVSLEVTSPERYGHVRSAKHQAPRLARGHPDVTDVYGGVRPVAEDPGTMDVPPDGVGSP